MCIHLEMIPFFTLSDPWHCDNIKMHKRDSSNLLNLTVIRVLIGIGVFAVFNVIAITVHHVVQRISRSQNLYRHIEHVYSPF